MEASLTCAVCLGVFREPVTLPLCSHNFCKSCVLECGEPHGRSLLLPSYVLDGGALSRPATAQVTCPLCRKVSAIPGGLSTLPVNTTLAELVRLLCLNPRECAPEAGYDDKEAGGRCQEHPEHKLELFCKNCAVACCGKCVSCHHQGIFHNVNLLDMVYQEEKLIFFNSLKKLREMNERFTKNASEEAKDEKVTLRKNIGVVKAAFDETFKALELKKLQYYEFIKQQQIFETKRQEVRKKAMAHHKSTVEALLKDCESLVDEFEPKRFLQMACSLNKRMTSNLDLMELTASHDKDIVNADLIHVDLKPVLDAISAVNVTECPSNVSQPKCNGIVFKTITKIRKPEQTPDERFCPVQSQELCYLQGQIQKMAIRLLSITEMPEYKHMSFEELRMKYYGNLVVQENGEALSKGSGQILPNIGDHSSLGTAEATGLCAKIRKSTESSGVSSTFNKNKQETIVKTESKMEIAQDGQMEPVASAPFMFPTPAAVRAKEPVVCSSKGVTSRAVFDDRDQKKAEVFKQENNTNVFPRFCLGKLDTKDLKKTSNTGKPWKKPKTASFLPTTANAESLTSRTLFKFDNKTDLESKVPDLFYNPFSQQECKAQGNESKSLSEDHATQSNSCEEFYDAKSDAEEAEETGRPSTSTG